MNIKLKNGEVCCSSIVRRIDDETKEQAQAPIERWIDDETKAQAKEIIVTMLKRNIDELAKNDNLWEVREDPQSTNGMFLSSKFGVFTEAAEDHLGLC